MTIEINESGNPEFFVSRHFIAYGLGDQRYTIVRSGIVLLPNESQEEAAAARRPWSPNGFKGQSGGRWRPEHVVLNLDLTASIARLNPPPAQPGTYWTFKMDQWAPVVGLNSIYNQDVSNNAGSSVNTFLVSQPTPMNSVSLEMDIAVSDSDGYILRVGFYLTLVGHLVEMQPVG
jgi:hypothetical protein